MADLDRPPENQLTKTIDPTVDRLQGGPFCGGTLRGRTPSGIGSSRAKTSAFPKPPVMLNSTAAGVG